MWMWLNKEKQYQCFLNSRFTFGMSAISGFEIKVIKIDIMYKIIMNSRNTFFYLQIK